MKKVEYRLLQFIVSHVTGDRVSVALVHWDRERLRVASSFDRLAVCPARQRPLVRATVRAFLSQSENAAQTARAEPANQVALATLLDVREGLGGALHWAPLEVAETSDAERHFQELSAHLSLATKLAQRQHRYSSRTLAHQLSKEIADLAERMPDRVKVDHNLGGERVYRSPLSWKNGVWHDVLPLSLDGLRDEEITRESAQLLGLAVLAVPDDHIPVIVAAIPSQPDEARRTDEEATAVQHRLRSRNCLVLNAPMTKRSPSFDEVRRRVEADTKQSD